VEAIDHARAAGVPILVAINKIDKEGAKPDRVMQELSKHNLVPEEWGGKTIYVQISAKKKVGLEKLLEMLLLEADLLELKADPKRSAKGVVIEAKLDKGRGAVATVLVQKGKVNVGDMVLAGNHFGRVRALISDHGKKIDEAGPSTPVEVLGLSGIPAAGDAFQVVEDERLARQISAKRLEAQKERERNAAHVKLEGLFDQIQAGDLKELKIVLKADVAGSGEAIKDSLERIESAKVKVRVIHSGVGALNETDVMLASASNAIILGFHVKAEGKAADLAKAEQVDVRFYEVIYDLVNDVKTSMEGLLEPKFAESVTGKGEVRGVFKTSAGLIAGAMISSGKVTRGGNARLLRNGEKVWEGKVDTLKRFKDDAKEVGAGMECGLGLQKPPADLAVGDQLEFITLEAVAQKL
jgi:translation initiation factor IF-2